MSIASIFAVAALAAAVPAVAAEPPARSVTVGYADLDLASTADQDRLNARIGRAARMVCGAPPVELGQRGSTMDCRTAAKADAQARLLMVLAPTARETQVAGTGGSITVRTR